MYIKMKHIIRIHRVSIMIVISSMLCFILFYGIRVLDTGNTGWLMTGGDLSQHYLGWKFYRNAPWQWQIGMMNNIAYPFSESIIFTDSIPLFAVIFKILSPLLPENFQYFGLWGLFCFMLQGLFAFFILKKYLKNDWQLLLASILFIAAPVMLKRMYWHSSLAAHFLILMAIYLFIYSRERYRSRLKAAAAWGGLGALCASIHIYFLPMCGVILLGSLAEDFWYEKKWGRLIAPLIAFMSGAVCIIWLLGGLSSGMDDGAPGLAYYSFNLNGFFNPQGWSLFLKDMSYYADGQFEGFAYVGLGIIVLLGAAAAAIYVRIAGRKIQWKQELQAHPKTILSAVALVILILAAASNEITLGAHLLLRYEIPYVIEELWSPFRSSGRLVWPAVYLLMLFAIAVACRWSRMKSTVVLLCLCLFIQLYDMSDIIKEKQVEFWQEKQYVTPLQDTLWEDLKESGQIEHIVFLDKENLSQEMLYAIADYATSAKMSINDFYFARNLMHPIAKVAEDFAAHPESGCVYIFTQAAREACTDYELFYYEADGLIAGFLEPQKERQEWQP